MKFNKIFVLLVIVILSTAAQAQKRVKYSYAAQKALIPIELGKVYLGMPVSAFAALVDLKNAEADGKFAEVALQVPLAKGNLESFRIKFAGVTEDEKAAFLRPDRVTRKGEYGDYEEEIGRIDVGRVPKGAFVYEIVVTFKPGFDVKKYAVQKYGATKNVYKPGDQYHIYDMQWTKKTTDSLVWLIRYYEETRSIGLYGRIKGSEWSVD